jgi:hypothetical protein
MSKNISSTLALSRPRVREQYFPSETKISDVSLDLAINRESKTRQSAPDVAARSLRATGVYTIVNEDWEKRARPQMACYGASRRRFAPRFIARSRLVVQRKDRSHHRIPFKFYVVFAAFVAKERTRKPKSILRR